MDAVAKAGSDLDTDCRHADRLLVSFEVEHHAIAHANTCSTVKRRLISLPDS